MVTRIAGIFPTTRPAADREPSLLKVVGVKLLWLIHFPLGERALKQVGDAVKAGPAADEHVHVLYPVMIPLTLCGCVGLTGSNRQLPA